MIPLTRLPGGPNMLVPGSPSRATKLQVAGPPHSTPVGARNPFGDPPRGIDGEFGPHTPITGFGFDPLTGIPLLTIPLSAAGPLGKTTNWRLPAPPLAPPGTFQFVTGCWVTTGIVIGPNPLEVERAGITSKSPFRMRFAGSAKESALAVIASERLSPATARAVKVV